MIRLALTFPVFNALEYTKKCLHDLQKPVSLINNRLYQISIIIVDDGSSDGSYDWIKINYPDVILCKGDGNLWWSGGVNMGIRYAIEKLNSDYVLLWNNDVRAEDDYFVELFKILSASPVDQVILSKVYIENRNNNKRIISSLGGTFDPVWGKLTLVGFGEPEEGFIDHNAEIKWFPGMGTVLHTSVFGKIGFFDEEYFPQYKGDADYGIRAYNAGYRLVVYPGLKIWNDRTNTGFSNDKSIIEFFRSLFSRKSNTNFYRDFLFYKRHGKSILVYVELLRKYFMHIGGFIKWKILGLFGYKRNRRF